MSRSSGFGPNFAFSFCLLLACTELRGLDDLPPSSTGGASGSLVASTQGGVDPAPGGSIHQGGSASQSSQRRPSSGSAGLTSERMPSGGAPTSSDGGLSNASGRDASMSGGLSNEGGAPGSSAGNTRATGGTPGSAASGGNGGAGAASEDLGGSAGIPDGAAGAAGKPPDPPRVLPFFSEYVEGISSDKALEVVTPEPSSLEGCSIRVYSNGSLTPSHTMQLTETVSISAPLVVCTRKMADLAGMADEGAACTRIEALSFNGNDAVLLVCDGAVVDAIGRLGENPGERWGSAQHGTLDVALRRSCAIIAGDTDAENAFDPGAEGWLAAGPDHLDDLGFHCAEASPSTAPHMSPEELRRRRPPAPKPGAP